MDDLLYILGFQPNNSGVWKSQTLGKLDVFKTIFIVVSPISTFGVSMPHNSVT